MKDSTRPSTGKKVLRALGIALLVVVVLTGLWVKRNLYASELTPTQLNAQEQKALDDKLALLDNAPKPRGVWRHAPVENAEPEAYSEAGAKREITITERELNAIIGRNKEMSKRVAIDLSRDLVSVTMILPMEEDFPLVGGTTLRLHIGLTLSYERGKPVVALKGISLGGVPLPNAWLGGLKGVNLIDEFSEPGGFWDLFAAGVRDLKVENGKLLVKLSE